MNRKLIVESLSVLLTLCLAAPALSEPPAQSGPHVYRYQDNYWFWFADSDTGLLAIFGIGDLVEACTGPFEPEEVTVMDNVTDEESLRIVSRFYGEVSVTVWEATGLDCDQFTSELPLAYGTVTFSGNDNDYYAFLPNERSNKNSYSYRANGPVWSSLTGERMRLHLAFHGLWGGDNNPSFKPKAFVNIELH